MSRIRSLLTIPCLPLWPFFTDGHSSLVSPLFLLPCVAFPYPSKLKSLLFAFLSSNTLWIFLLRRQMGLELNLKRYHVVSRRDLGSVATHTYISLDLCKNRWLDLDGVQLCECGEASQIVSHWLSALVELWHWTDAISLHLDTGSLMSACVDVSSTSSFGVNDSRFVHICQHSGTLACE